MRLVTHIRQFCLLFWIIASTGATIYLTRQYSLGEIFFCALLGASLPIFGELPSVFRATTISDMREYYRNIETIDAYGEMGLIVKTLALQFIKLIGCMAFLAIATATSLITFLPLFLSFYLAIPLFALAELLDGKDLIERHHKYIDKRITRVMFYWFTDKNIPKYLRYFCLGYPIWEKPKWLDRP